MFRYDCLVVTRRFEWDDKGDSRAGELLLSAVTHLCVDHMRRAGGRLGTVRHCSRCTLLREAAGREERAIPHLDHMHLPFLFN